MSPLAQVVALPVRAYRLLLSPWIGHACRFQPTCSAYALEALDRHGAGKGALLTLRRIARCHPWGGSGHDPVPPASPVLPQPLLSQHVPPGAHPPGPPS